MIRAEVRYDGAHKWAQYRFLKKTDVGFAVKIAADIVIIITIFVIDWLIFFKWKDHPEMWLYAAELTILMGVAGYSLISAIVKKVKADRAVKNAPHDGYVRHYIIDGDSIRTEYTSDDEHGSCNLRYDGIAAALETGDFYLFRCTSAPNRAYSIRKTELTEGTPDELTGLFRDRLGERFRRCVP